MKSVEKRNCVHFKKQRKHSLLEPNTKSPKKWENIQFYVMYERVLGNIPEGLVHCSCHTIPGLLHNTQKSQHKYTLIMLQYPFIYQDTLVFLALFDSVQFCILTLGFHMIAMYVILMQQYCRPAHRYSQQRTCIPNLHNNNVV